MLQFIASIGGVIPGLFGKRLSFGAAKVAGFATLAILALAVISLGKCAYDASVIDKYQTEQAAKSRESERRANRIDASEDAKEIELQDKLGDAADEARRADPAGASQPVGPVTKSYYDTIRKEQDK